MSIERGSEPQPARLRRSAADAVVVVRRALAREEAVTPMFPGEPLENAAAIVVLADRLKRLKSRGVEFNEIELSVYAKHLMPGSGPVPVAS